MSFNGTYHCGACGECVHIAKAKEQINGAVDASQDTGKFERKKY